MSRTHPELRTPPALPDGGLRVIALGGLGEIGRNMTVFEHAGKLLIVASGPRALYEQAEPCLQAMSRKVMWVGEGELARIWKIAHNTMFGVIIQNLCEITVLAEKAGIPIATTNSFDGTILNRSGISHTGQDASAAAIGGEAAD